MKYIVFLLICFGAFSQDSINKLDSNGQRHGLWKGFYEKSKRPRYEGVFKNGKETGIFKYYDDTKAGTVIATRDFSKNDGSCYAIFYDQKNNKVSEGKLVNKLPNGKWIYYHYQSKEIMSTENYADGKLSGEKKVFYKDNTLAEISNYINGNRVGIYKKYSEKGELLEELNYTKGELDGKAIYYDGLGNKIYEGNYLNGKKVGKWKFYEKGKVIKEVSANKFAKELIKYEQKGAEKKQDAKISGSKENRKKE